ncbi:hypothetical protein [Pontibacter sp. G13]|uniref:hypothetical protein n=1 Tax=Pontibacter sp. G13 TaxID=3074898 RepID=UPI00288B137C|nr:hypothetical protein [Pontibacter sp. G13]WNJ19556.1 hypothetical protein RJD25_03620 [Pontibacter sp. G13]
MLDGLFLVFILCFALYLLLARRKEVPLFIAMHAIAQYVFTLVTWFFHMNSQLTGLLLGMMFLTTALLLWARNLDYSRELHAVQLFFSISQWAALAAAGAMCLFEPYTYLPPSSFWHPFIASDRQILHPVIKFLGNFLLFTTFFQIILHWGQRWSRKKSWIDLSPLFLYLILLVIMNLMRGTEVHHPFS